MNSHIVAMAVKATIIMDKLGLKIAVGYLQRRGFSAEQAVNILLRRIVC